MDMAIQNNVRRVNPRRPFTVNADGVRRVVLGQLGDGDAIGNCSSQALIHDQPHHAAKPVRLAAGGATTACLLAVAHSDRGALDEHARQVVAAAALLADGATEVVLLVFGELNDDVAALGADRCIVLPQYGGHVFAPEAELAALSALTEELQPAHIFMPDDGVAGSDLGRRLGAAGAGIATHVVEISQSGLAAYRQQGSMLARRSLAQIILLETDVVDARLPFLGRGQLADQLGMAIGTAAGAAASSSPFLDLGSKTMAASQMELDEADFIVSAGNGVDDVALFNALANALDAAVGASRVAVDDGKFKRDKQIGATGKTVSASAYLAFGISGAVQHLQGIKDCRHVIAVNLDASAPMIKRADLSIIGDAQELMTALLDQVRQARSAEAAS
ncbi:electron transfer flavoprotein subunit alpha/FixB family protein [Collimonas fungivorans]|uniref:Electron transfer flavoprotein, alpha subunit n=1 Tax=Collimonas fungivorans (strain Ter331) TaxID=1005048 RepID=G0ACQ2_COLFT|nr:electron transfer flavoprotein subunit alpha/FixB family protein [Collimonas fungivorans]AEK62926.1 Electron transfer flavoprotein, alpha subunit [Collimonas fungivorans Ter331]